MKKKSQRMQVIVDLNADNEKKALEALGKSLSKKQELQTQLDHLQQYQQEYKDKYQSISKLGVNIAQLLEFRSFISKLQQAIEEQKQAILKQENNVTLARKNWEKQHQKTSSLQKVCDSALAEEVKLENKREQNEQDERATRSGRGNGTRNA
jgi:flagellar FliJ protein